MIKQVFFLFLFPSLFLSADINKSCSVLVVGGGPAGLASAIEATNQGYKVTILEKREHYSRSQPIGVTSNSLRLLKKWDIFIPEIQLSNMDPDGDDFSGVLRINSLEKYLAKKCKTLGIERIYGEFQGFGEGHSIVIKTEEKDFVLSYDVLIGSDGFHSRVRDALSIPTKHFAVAKGSYVIIPDLMNLSKGSSFFVRQGDSFARFIRTPIFTIIAMQNPFDASKDKVRSFLERQGWKREVKAIDRGHISEFIENIPITLSQAEVFCDPERSVVLLGDAVVSVSFLFGDGLNTALSSSELVGFFLENWKKDKNIAFQEFNQSMKILTNQIIIKSSALFNFEYENLDRIVLDYDKR